MSTRVVCAGLMDPLLDAVDVGVNEKHQATTRLHHARPVPVTTVRAGPVLARADEMTGDGHWRKLRSNP